MGRKIAINYQPYVIKLELIYNIRIILCNMQM